MAHFELLVPICTGIAVAVARLRWIVWSKLACGRCSKSFPECGCKPSWKMLFL